MTPCAQIVNMPALLVLALAAGASSASSSCGEGGSATTPAAQSATGSGRLLSTDAFGAVGDGKTPATAALQKAVDAAGPGDTLRFAAGTYVIDTTVGLKLKDGVILDLGDAVLTGPNVSGARCRLIDIQGGKNIVIRGGTLVGSRVGSPQWGIGILASDAENLLIENVTLRDFYYDGILLTGNNRCRGVTIRGVVSENNRRTGLAIVAASDVLVENSIFRGSKGQSPEAGINVEPNAGDLVERVRFVGNTFSGNTGNGVYIHRALGVSVTEAAVENSVVQDNVGGAIVVGGVESVRISGNRVSGHSGKGRSGIHIGTGKQAVISDNRLENNYRGIFSAGGTGVEIRGNTITGSGVTADAGDDANGIVCLGLADARVEACTVSGNTVRRTAASGIVAQSVTRVRIADNIIEDAGRRGIYLRSASSSEVRGNSVSAGGSAGPGQYDGIEIALSANENLIAANTIRRGPTMRLPIGIGPGCRGNQLVDNVVLP